MSSTSNLFVYGTLRRDTRHELFRLLARHAHFLGDATTYGKLYDLGDYPGLVSSESGRVVGEVYEINPAHWDRVISLLDQYEGCTSLDPAPHEYRREVVPVTLSNGDTIAAWAYILNRQPDRSREISSGDYLSWRAKAHA